MHIVYLISRYPNVSETFIAREMQQLIDLGHRITIAQLRWSQPWAVNHGMTVSPVAVLPPQFGPIPWIKGLRWAIKYKPDVLKEIWHDFSTALIASEYRNRFKLCSILLTTLRLAQLLDQQGVEHIRNRFLFGGALSAMWLSRLLNTSYSLTVSTQNAPFPATITQKSVRSAAFCTVPTQETLEMVTTLRGTEHNVHLIRTGLNLRAFETSDNQEKNLNAPLILAVGRLVKKKGFDILLQACALLQQQHIDFTCKIIGDGSEHAALKNLINTYNLQERVSLTGALPFESVKQHFRNASVIAVPSRVMPGDQDGLPNVITEALALKVPVIATPVAAIPELIVHEQTGLLVPPDDAAQLADAIRRVITDQALRDTLIHAGYQKMREEFDIVQTVQHMQSLIVTAQQPTQQSSQEQDSAYVS